MFFHWSLKIRTDKNWCTCILSEHQHSVLGNDFVMVKYYINHSSIFFIFGGGSHTRMSKTSCPSRGGVSHAKMCWLDLMGQLKISTHITYIYSWSPGDGRAATFIGVDHLIDMTKTCGTVDVTRYASSTMKWDQTRVETSVSGSHISRGCLNLGCTVPDQWQLIYCQLLHNNNVDFYFILRSHNQHLILEMGYTFLGR